MRGKRVKKNGVCVLTEDGHGGSGGLGAEAGVLGDDLTAVLPRGRDCQLGQGQGHPLVVTEQLLWEGRHTCLVVLRMGWHHANIDTLTYK